MQHLDLGTDFLRAYHKTLQSDHDFKVWANILTLDHTYVATADLLDGQVNYKANQSSGPDRTCTLTLSDPEGALAFGSAYASDDTGTIWVDRIVQVRHELTVPNFGVVTTTPFIGVPTSVGRDGGEIGLELSDKSILADHGVQPKTYRKGQNVRSVLVDLLAGLTGEGHYRIPATRKTLGASYTVGMGEDALTPWRLAKRIAAKECGWRLFYSGSGFAVAEPTSAKRPIVDVDDILTLPRSSTSFTDFSNYVKVTSHRKRKISGQTRNVIYQSVATLPPGHRLSASSLGRNGVPRLLPLVISDDEIPSASKVRARAIHELKDASEIDSENSYEIMPIFHLDQGDRVRLPQGIGVTKFTEASIPLGTGGNMVIGRLKWVSKPAASVRVRSSAVVVRKKSRGGKKKKHG